MGKCRQWFKYAKKYLDELRYPLNGYQNIVAGKSKCEKRPTDIKQE